MDLDELEKQLELEIEKNDNEKVNDISNNKREIAIENLKKAREKLQQKRKQQKPLNKNNIELRQIETPLRTQTETQYDTIKTQYDTIYNELNKLKNEFYGYLEEKKQKKKIKDTVKNQIDHIQKPLIGAFNNVLNKIPLNEQKNDNTEWIKLNNIKNNLLE